MKYWPGFLLLLASWLQPLHLLPWVSWHSEVLAFAAISWFFAVELMEQKKQRCHFFVWPTAAFLPLVMVLLVWIQFGLGLIHFFGDALVICFYLAMCSVAIAVGGAWGARSLSEGINPNTQSLVYQLAIALSACAVLSVFLALAQAFDVWNLVDWIVRLPGFRRPGANVGQPNHFATLQLMGVASVGLLFESRRVGYALANVLLALLVLGLAMSESRTGLLSAVVLTAWWVFKRRVVPFRFTAAPIIAGWIGLLFLLWAWPKFITHCYFVSGGASLDTSAGSRLLVWAQLLEAAMQHPWLGWGFREISKAHNAILDHYQHSEPFTYAHNLVLDLVVGLGFPIAVALLGFLANWFWHRLRSTTSLVPWYCIALVVPVVVHSMLEYPFSYAYFLIPVMLVVGVLEAHLAPSRIYRWRLSFTAMSALLLLLFLAWSVTEYVRIEEDFRVARFDALHIGKTPIEYERPTTYLLTQLDTMVTATRIVPSSGMNISEIELLRSAAMRFPWTAIQNRYALALALNGNREEAVRQLKVMRAMHGEKTYAGIRANWEALAESKYPELGKLKFP
jgi:O-antigen ligase